MRRKTQKREKGRQENHKKEIDLLFVFQCCDGIGDRCFYRLVADSEKCDNPGNTPCQEKCSEADPGAVRAAGGSLVEGAQVIGHGAEQVRDGLGLGGGHGRCLRGGSSLLRAGGLEAGDCERVAVGPLLSVAVLGNSTVQSLPFFSMD